MSRWENEDLERDHKPDKDPHPEIKDRDPDEEPPRAKLHPAHPEHPGDPDPHADDAAEG